MGAEVEWGFLVAMQVRLARAEALVVLAVTPAPLVGILGVELEAFKLLMVAMVLLVEQAELVEV